MSLRKTYDSLSSSDASTSSVAKSYNESDGRERWKNRIEKDALHCNSKSSVRKFGDFQDTCDWVECESKSYPNKIYFFNLRSLCATWTRPVSRHVQLQRFCQRTRVFNDDLSYELECPLMIVSDDDESDSDCTQDPQAAGKIKSKDKRANTLARLNYGVDTLRFLDETKSEQLLKYLKNPELYESSRVLRSAVDYSSKNVNLDDEGDDSFQGERSPFAATDFLETQLHILDSSQENHFSEQSEQDDRSMENDNDDRVPGSYAVPCLRKIEAKYLLDKIGPKRKPVKKSGNAISQRKKRTEPVKIVCEINGIKTINYDPGEPELPAGIRVTNLSDSSVTLSMGSNVNADTASRMNFKFGDLDLKSPKLSSTGSSSSSTSSDSPSRSSSETSGTSSSSSSSETTSETGSSDSLPSSTSETDDS